MRSLRFSRCAARSGLPLSSLASMRIEDASAAAVRRHEARHGGERRVAVVSRAPTVEEVALAHGLARARGRGATRRAAAACPCGRRSTMGSPVPPLSTSSSGVRPGSCTISAVSAASWSCDPVAARSSAAAAMAPRSSQSGSKAGERQGMRVYSLSVGRIRSSQAASMSSHGGVGAHDSVIAARRSSDLDICPRCAGRACGSSRRRPACPG